MVAEGWRDELVLLAVVVCVRDEEVELGEVLVLCEREEEVVVLAAAA